MGIKLASLNLGGGSREVQKIIQFKKLTYTTLFKIFFYHRHHIIVTDKPNLQYHNSLWSRTFPFQMGKLLLMGELLGSVSSEITCMEETLAVTESKASLSLRNTTMFWTLGISYDTTIQLYRGKKVCLTTFYLLDPLLTDAGIFPVWSGHSRWLFSHARYIPCLTSACFTYTCSQD